MNQQKPFHIAIMAAGKGTRMKSDMPKVLHPLAGRSMIIHVILTAFQLQPEKIFAIVGHQADRVRQEVMASREAFDRERLVWVEQREQLGTGHAIMQLKPYLKDFQGDLLILNGDIPLLSEPTLARFRDSHQQAAGAGTLLTMHLEDPTGYGRILREDGRLAGIVEQKDASLEQKVIQEVNPGVYFFDWPVLDRVLDKLGNDNAQGEYYLTDAIHHLVAGQQALDSVLLQDPIEVAGINSRRQLAELEQVLRRQINDRWMEAGVTMRDPHNTYVDCQVVLAPDTTLLPGTILEGWTRIGTGCTLGPHTQLRDTEVGDGCEIAFSMIEESRIGQGVKIGPYSHIRPGSVLDDGCRVGNFVELKNTHLHPGTKASHLSYLGDAEVGEQSNIGAGTITCNYDGTRKHRTQIGKRVFIGSNSTLVAPLAIDDDAYIAAGSAITDHVPPGALGIGRNRQVNKEEWVYHKQQAGEE